MGEILLEGSYKPIMIIDLANSYSKYGAQYNRSGEIFSKEQAIAKLSEIWGSYE